MGGNSSSSFANVHTNTDGSKTISGKFSNLEVRGAADVDITSDEEKTSLNTNIPTRAWIHDNNLTLESENVEISGSTTIISGFGYSSTIIGGTSIHSSGKSVHVKAPDIDKVRFNGKKVKYVDDDEKTDPKDNEYSKTWHVMHQGKKPELNHTKSVHASNINFYTDIFSRSTDFSIEGAGSIYIKTNHPLSFDTVCASIAGSGGIYLGDANIKSFTPTIAGSGNVSKFLVQKYFSGSIAGSGSIKGRKVSGCSVDRSIAGSGSISVS